MKLIRVLAILLAVLFCRAHRCVSAQEAPVPDPRQEPVVAQPEDPEVLLLDRLHKAGQHYDAGLEDFREGRIHDGRARLERSFAILTSLLEEDGLPTELREDFLGMLEKVRTWEGAQQNTESPSTLDVRDDELQTEPANGIPEPRARPHVIEIDPDNETTKKFVHLYTSKRPADVAAALARSGRYRDMIVSALRKARLPEELFYLVMAESEYKLKALSRSGAGGLWQFMPFTGRGYGLEVSYWVDERYDPEKATRAAIRYLSELREWFGDWHLAIAAYNRGENGIGRDLQFSRATDFATLSERGALPQETHHYVPKFMACVLIGENPERYGLNVEYEKPEPYDIVAIERDLDLEIAARCAGTTKAVLQRLNPELRAWCTPKKRKGYPLRVPKGTKDAFLSELAKVKDWNPGPQFVRYQVRKGDYLGKIASRYRTTVKSIARLNDIRDPRLIRPGMVLKVRPGKGFDRE
ncbi:MAG: transglycosylase SLT domain-containing protein [Elusimicrobiota bacterium]